MTKRGHTFPRYVDKLRTIHPYGRRLLDIVKPLNGRRAIVSFSGGKDSCALSLYLMRHYEEVVPFFMYIIPHLGFVEEAMDYYEQRLFKRPIRRIPHPSFLRWVRHFLYQDPTMAKVVAAAALPRLDVLALEGRLRDSEHLPKRALVATGIRAEDSPIRAMSLRRYGPITHSKQHWHPIWDWSKAEVNETISRAGLSLSPEYQWLPRSFSGIHWEYVTAIRKNAPRDFKKILEWMPLIEAELWRHERTNFTPIGKRTTGSGRHTVARQARARSPNEPAQ